MTSWQKAIKYTALVFAILLIIGIFSSLLNAFWIADDFVSINEKGKKSENYADFENKEISQNIISLDFDIDSVNLKIIEADEFSLETAVKDLKLKEENGCLKVKQKNSFGKPEHGDGITLYIPKDFVFENVKIHTSAGKFSASAVSAENIDLEFGAGKVTIDRLYAQKNASIDGGVGKVEIKDGNLNNADFEMGVGALKLTATLVGECDFDLGIGENDITLKGNKEDYKIFVDKGVGDIKIGSYDAHDGEVFGDGTNKIDLDCGIGAVNVEFSEEN